MTTANDLRILDVDELESRVAETQQELFNLRFQRVTGQLDNTARIKQLRREVARMKTIAREREIAEAEGEEAGTLAPASLGPAPPTRARRPASVVAAAEPSPLRTSAGEEADEADEADEVPEEGVAEEGVVEEGAPGEDAPGPVEDDEAEEAP